jgi:hypothetical protein
MVPLGVTAPPEEKLPSLAQGRIEPGRFHSNQSRALTIAMIASAVCKEKTGHDICLYGSVHLDMDTISKVAKLWPISSSVAKKVLVVASGGK